MIEFHCSKCGALHRVPGIQAGVAFYCESCRTNVTVPLRSEMPLPAAETYVYSAPSTAVETSQSAVSDEGETYAVAGGLAYGDDPALSPAIIPLGGDFMPAVGVPLDKPKKRRRKGKPTADEDDPDLEFETADRLIAVWQGVGRWVCLEIVLLTLFMLVMWGNDGITSGTVTLYVVGVLGLLGAAWLLAYQHARVNNRPVTGFQNPWQAARYSVRNWPETRQSLLFLGLGIGWLVVPIFLSVVFSMISGWITPAKETTKELPGPGQPAAAPMEPQPQPQGAPQMPVQPVPNVQPGANGQLGPNAQPKPGGMPQMERMMPQMPVLPPAAPAQTPAKPSQAPATPADAAEGPAVPVSSKTEVAPDGTVTTVVKSSDGTVTTTVKPPPAKSAADTEPSKEAKP